MKVSEDPEIKSYSELLEKLRQQMGRLPKFLREKRGKELEDLLSTVGDRPR